ncbi:MAG: YqgE/AlgH family protein [Gammaproteobacteria bacterium]
MTQTTSLTNQFLIAMPNLGDPNFSHTVTLMCQHNEDGALGIVVNRPTTMKLEDIFMQMEIKATDGQSKDIPVYAGGPVQQERGFVLHTLGDKWDSSLPISDSIALTTSRDILEAIAVGKGPEKILIALGYAGWGEGQLEREIRENAWLNTPSSHQILFDTPVDQRWNAAALQMGIDIRLLSTQAGHG